MKTRSLIATAVAAAALAAPHAASADDLYVQAGAGVTTCAQDDPCSLSQAIDVANVVSNLDTIHVTGALHFTGAVDLSPTPINLVGSGAGTGGTSIDARAGSLRVGAASSASGLAVTSSDVAVTLDTGGTVRDARIQGTNAGIDEHVASDQATTIDRVDIAHGYQGIRVVATPHGAGTTISESHIAGTRGVYQAETSVTDATFRLERSTIEASVGVDVAAANGATVVNSVIRATSKGVVARRDAEVFVYGTTIDGAGQGVVGVYLEPGSGSEVTLRDSIVRGFTIDLSAEDAPGPEVFVLVTYSDYGTSSGLNVLPGIGSTNEDPHWRDAGAGDYRLAADSPLIDQGSAGPAPLGETDRAGNPRVVDGDNDGTAVRDIGAYESQDVPRPPATPPTTTDPSAPGAVDGPHEQQQQQQQAPQQPPTPEQPVQMPMQQAPGTAALKLGLGSRKVTLDRHGRGTFSVTCNATPCAVKLVVATTDKRPRALATVSGNAGRLRIRLSRTALAYVKKHRVRRVAVTASAGKDRNAGRATRTVSISVH